MTTLQENFFVRIHSTEFCMFYTKFECFSLQKTYSGTDFF